MKATELWVQTDSTYVVANTSERDAQEEKTILEKLLLLCPSFLGRQKQQSHCKSESLSLAFGLSLILDTLIFLWTNKTTLRRSNSHIKDSLWEELFKILKTWSFEEQKCMKSENIFKSFYW